MKFIRVYSLSATKRIDADDKCVCLEEDTPWLGYMLLLQHMQTKLQTWAQVDFFFFTLKLLVAFFHHILCENIYINKSNII